MKNIISLPSPELESLLEYPGSISKANRIAIFRKGIESELLERSLGLTLAEAKERIRELEESNSKYIDPFYDCEDCEELLEEKRKLEREIDRLKAKLEERQ